MYWNHVISKFAIIPYGWIVTLDILKSLMEHLLLYRIGSWIVTLDVLKLYAEENTKSDYCRWIVTLDVLKSA